MVLCTERTYYLRHFFLLNRQNIQKKLEKLNIKENKQTKLQEEEADELEQCKEQESRLISYFERLLQTRDKIQQDEQNKTPKFDDDRNEENLLSEFITMKDRLSDVFELKLNEDDITNEDFVRHIKRDVSEFVSLLAYLIYLNFTVR